MLELNKIKTNKNQIIQSLNKRGADLTSIINEVINLNESRISCQKILDTQLHKGNVMAKEIGVIAKENKGLIPKELLSKATIIREESKKEDIRLKEIKENIQSLLIQIPNITHINVPLGKSEQDNTVEYEWGEISDISKCINPHWDIAEKYNIIDFETGAKIAGSGFPLYKGKGAKLQRGLINFFIDYNTDAGYEEYIPPFFVNEKSAFNTGQIPDKEGMMYHIKDDSLFVIPTSEIPITNIFNDVKFKQNDLPIKCTAYSPCFRREAGSYGKEVRGLNRLHQFDKVEIVQICEPEKSYDVLNEMVEHVSTLLKKLNLKFRIIKLCGGDLGFTAALTYDFEVYSGAQKKWLEVSSVSNFETYQSNRLNLKYIDSDKKSKLCHTLNGSSLALPRIVAAILENNQTSEGIVMPKILYKYLNFKTITNSK